MRYWDKGVELNNGKYIVEQILGSGGFGVTYRIRHTKNNKLFALKTLNLEAQAKPDFQQLQSKFINEAIALASCRHPNIVRVYPQGFQEDNLWCMVMEYVEGEDLSCYLDRNGKLDESQAVEIITKVGEALHFVHQQELLHRDIKPANILLRHSDFKPVLIDFGLAREYTHGQSIMSMTNSRTLSFAPPEQFQARGNFGAWTDVYALAATLYVLLTNELPLPALFRQHADLKPPQEFNSNISDRINQAIVRGMAMQIRDRPQSVREWLFLLREIEKIYIYPKLSQSSGINYSKLEMYLSNGNWQKANEFTQSFMIYQGEPNYMYYEINNEMQEFWVLGENFEAFENILKTPCEDLKIIDDLWTKYSKGKFGFSVQRKIWDKCEGNIKDFAESISWSENEKPICYNKIIFSLMACKGHLPCFRGGFYTTGDTGLRGEGGTFDEVTYIFLVDFMTNSPCFEWLGSSHPFIHKADRIKLREDIHNGKDEKTYLYKEFGREAVFFLDDFFSLVNRCL